MKIFACFLPMLDHEKSTAYRQEHLDYLESQRSAGRIIANGRFVDGWGGLVIYKAATMEEAVSYAENDPYIIKQAGTYDIHEWDMVSTVLQQ